MPRPNLRRKSPKAPSVSASSSACSEKEQPKIEAPAVNPSWSFSARLLKLVAGFALLATASMLYTKPRGDINLVLPESYVLCSRNGPAIYTVDSDNTKVQCLVVHDSRILDTGSLDEVTEKWTQRQHGVSSEKSQVVFETPLKIKFIPSNSIVIPGMTDSHGHILEYGASRMLPIENCKDSTAVVARVREFIIAHPNILNDTSKFIEGWGWDHTAWPVEEFPSFKELEADPVVRGRPIILQSKDGHAQWVSEDILKTMFPLPDEVEGGVIERDDEGNPTGVFLDNAQHLIKRPALTHADRLQRFNLAVNDALSKGLTSLHDAGFDPASLEFFKRQSELGKLPVRIYGMTHFDENAEYWGNKTGKIIDNDRLTARSVKIFADGALRSGGAALFEPYADNPETNGFMRTDPEVLYEFVPKFLIDGWQVNIHAIGDRANSIVLDVLESALKDVLKGVDGTAIRPRIEHAQIIRPEDTVRLAKLGVIASVQPTHVVSDMWFAQDRLGPERVKNLYAFRTILDAGARITLGSDFPVEEMNPFASFHAAITRVSTDGRSPHGPDGWFPEQRLTRVEALRGRTIDPAYASFSENVLGSLERGKFADYVVLSQDIMTVTTDKILDTKVLATALDGQLAFGRV